MSALTKSGVTQTSGTVGTAAAAAISAATFNARNFLMIQNVDSSKFIAYTLDGTDPVIYGNGFTLGPLGSAMFDVFVPTGPVRVIGSADGAAYTVAYS